MTSSFFGGKRTKKIATPQKGGKNMVKCVCLYLNEYLELKYY